MTFAKGQRVSHPIYGLGTIVEKWFGRGRSLNLAVKFDKGGPVGFAQKATHAVEDLTPHE